MAVADAEPGTVEIVEISSPTEIGDCCYCQLPLYADQPTSQLDEPLSHVGCAVDARRTGKRL